MSKVNNDAINLDVSVTINWYLIGRQFAMESDENQYELFSGLVDEMKDWDYATMLNQIQSIADICNKRRSDSNKKLASFLTELAGRLEV